MRHGQGVQTFSDGRKYQGLWENGEMHGEGKMISCEGIVVQEGMWINGEYQELEVQLL